MGFEEVVLCASLGKAMGVTAGILAGTAHRIEELGETPFFAGASPAPPAGISTLLKAIERKLYQKKWKLLATRVAYFQDRVERLGSLTSHKGYPVLSFRDRNLVSHLLKKRIVITDFRYPAEGEMASPSRIVITAAHREAQLRHLAEVLAGFENY
jgi:7-keto-8-aminopelargonate synthetase-like enzyme